MKIGIATDHNGVEEKKIIIEYLKTLGYDIIDFSTNNTPIDDYPDFAFDVADAVNKEIIDLGVLMCGTGIGMSIAANKVKGIRCAKVSSVEEAQLAREHNNANIIAVSYKEAIDKLNEMIHTFATSKFAEDERHIRRIRKISNKEDN